MQLELYSGHEYISREKIAHANAAETLQKPQAFFWQQKLPMQVQPKLYNGQAFFHAQISPMLTACESLQWP